MRKLPARKPRTECDCHPVASIISGIVAPRLAFRSVMTAAAFEPGREGGAGDADFAGVTALDFVLGARAMTASPSSAPAQCRRSHHPKPREPRGEPLLLPAVCTRQPTAHSNASRALEVQSNVRLRSRTCGRSISRATAVLRDCPAASRLTPTNQGGRCRLRRTPSSQGSLASLGFATRQEHRDPASEPRTRCRGAQQQVTSPHFIACSVFECGNRLRPQGLPRPSGISLSARTSYSAARLSRLLSHERVAHGKCWTLHFGIRRSSAHVMSWLKASTWSSCLPFGKARTS